MSDMGIVDIKVNEIKGKWILIDEAKGLCKELESEGGCWLNTNKLIGASKAN
jgi:hypothetical protein